MSFVGFATGALECIIAGMLWSAQLLYDVSFNLATQFAVSGGSNVGLST